MPGPTSAACVHDTPCPTQIVGLGASAGGLEALEQFLSHVPADSGLAYVVVQHLDPHHKAMLVELLQRCTLMPVCEAVQAMAIRPNRVYVIPPNTELSVSGAHVQLTEPTLPRGLRLPVDVLFCSLARDLGERAIGVVLSGMGSDGTLGLQAIRSQAGLTAAQQPESAQFDSMPSSAVRAGVVDIVDLAAALPQRILRAARAGQAHATSGGDAQDGEAAAMDQILALLHARSKHDLSAYKPSTLRRRIERRMSLHGAASMTDYATLLRRSPQELDLLFKEMLIGVTQFFRDASVWHSLGDRVLEPLLQRCVPGQRVRAWVVGCSTGEEAYTLAIAMEEAAQRLPQRERPGVQIFASDLSADAIAVARRGHYLASIAADVGAQRLSRFFTVEGSGYRICKEVRERVLFVQHDVIMDPPFTKLDLLSCRNLMIYFNEPLQRRLLPLFHYSLRPGGILLIGGSETVGRSHALFTPVDNKSRLYRRSDNALLAGSVDFPTHRSTPMRTGAQELIVSDKAQLTPNLQSLADQVVLQHFAPAAVLVNGQGDIVYINGRTGKYLEPAAGKANWNIHVMARPGIRLPLAVALRQCAQQPSIELSGLRLEGDPPLNVDLTVQALREPHALQGMVMIVFRDAPVAVARRRRASPSVDPLLSEELSRSREENQALREEMRASEEELQAANEELQSTNEDCSRPTKSSRPPRKNHSL